MFCKICGTQLSDDSKFCAVCGTKVEPIQTEATVAPVVPAKKKVKPIAIILPIIAVMLVAAIALGVVFFGGKNSSDDNQTDKENITISEKSDDTDNENDMNSQQTQTDKVPEEKYYIPVKYTYTYSSLSDGERITENEDILWSYGSVKRNSGTYKFNSDGQLTEESYNPGTEFFWQRTYTYSDGRLSKVDDDTFYSYDSNGNITHITDKDSDWAINYFYDSQNRLIKRTVDGDDDDFYYEYPDDKTVVVTAYEGTPDQYTCTLYYNENGNLIKRIICEGELVEESNYEYDENNNLKTIKVSSNEEDDKYAEFTWAEGTKEQALFAKNNMSELAPCDAAPYNFTNAELMKIPE